jgi:hypothetical protein
MSSGEWIGTLGVSVLLIAFALNLLKKLEANSGLYLLMNVLGGSLACVSSLMIQFWPFVVLEGVWAISSLVMLLRINKVQ